MYIYLNETLRKTPALGLQNTKLFELVFVYYRKFNDHEALAECQPPPERVNKKNLGFFFNPECDHDLSEM